MNKWTKFTSWFLKILISLGFLMASLGKLTQNPAVIKMFEDWGFFDGFYLLIGVLELLLAILLLIPRTSLYGAYGLVIIMIGAFFTHLLNDPPSELIRPIIFSIFLATIIYLQRKHLKQEAVS